MVEDTKETAPAPYRLERESLSELLHTALRKECDSPITTLAWNLFHVVDEETCDIFYDKVWKGLENAEIHTPHDVEDAVKNAILSDKSWWVGNPKLAVLPLCFRMFDEYDWGGYIAYIEEEIFSQ